VRGQVRRRCLQRRLLLQLSFARKFVLSLQPGPAIVVPIPSHPITTCIDEFLEART